MSERVDCDNWQILAIQLQCLIKIKEDRKVLFDRFVREFVDLCLKISCCVSHVPFSSDSVVEFAVIRIACGSINPHRSVMDEDVHQIIIINQKRRKQTR